MSARILGTLMETVRNAISSYVRNIETKYWLSILQHRVNEILKRSQKDEWDHVAGINNPVYLGSRGVTASQLIDSNKW